MEVSNFYLEMRVNSQTSGMFIDVDSKCVTNAHEKLKENTAQPNYSVILLLFEENYPKIDICYIPF